MLGNISTGLQYQKPEKYCHRKEYHEQPGWDLRPGTSKYEKSVLFTLRRYLVRGKQKILGGETTSENSVWWVEKAKGDYHYDRILGTFVVAWWMRGTGIRSFCYSDVKSSGYATIFCVYSTWCTTNNGVLHSRISSSFLSLAIYSVQIFSTAQRFERLLCSRINGRMWTGCVPVDQIIDISIVVSLLETVHSVLTN